MLSGREALRNTGQGVLLDAVTAYTNVLANQSLVEAQRINVTFLRETLGTTKKRLEGGDVTPTDVAQAEARLSRGLADLNAVEVGLAISQALYAQVIGAPPGRLVPPGSIDRLLPLSREEAIAISRKEHPAILGAMYDIDVAQLGTKIAESSLWPTVGVQAGLQHQWEADPTLSTKRLDNAFVLVVPGALEAGLGELRFWLPLLAGFVIAWPFAFAVNRAMIRRGKGHAEVHSRHRH